MRPHFSSLGAQSRKQAEFSTDLSLNIASVGNGHKKECTRTANALLFMIEFSDCGATII